MRKLFCLSAPEEYFGLQPSRHPLPYQLGGLGRQDGGQRECWPVPQHQWHAPSILYTCKDATSWTDARQFHGLHVIWWLYAHITDRFMDKKSMNITFRLTGQGQDILIYIFIHRTQMGYGVFTSWFFFFFSFSLFFSSNVHSTLIYPTTFDSYPVLEEKLSSQPWDIYNHTEMFIFLVFILSISFCSPEHTSKLEAAFCQNWKKLKHLIFLEFCHIRCK